MYGQNNVEAEEFNNYKDALVEQKLERDHSLLEETNCHWEQIFDQRFVLLKSLLTPKSQMLKWVWSHLVVDHHKVEEATKHSMLVSGTCFCTCNGATCTFESFKFINS